jgi:hypothetical protein
MRYFNAFAATLVTVISSAPAWSGPYAWARCENEDVKIELSGDDNGMGIDGWKATLIEFIADGSNRQLTGYSDDSEARQKAGVIAGDEGHGIALFGLNIGDGATRLNVVTIHVDAEIADKCADEADGSYSTFKKCIGKVKSSNSSLECEQHEAGFK